MRNWFLVAPSSRIGFSTPAKDLLRCPSPFFLGPHGSVVQTPFTGIDTKQKVTNNLQSLLTIRFFEEHRSGVELDPDCEMQQHVASLNALASALLWSTEARVINDIARGRGDQTCSLWWSDAHRHVRTTRCCTCLWQADHNRIIQSHKVSLVHGDHDVALAHTESQHQVQQHAGVKLSMHRCRYRNVKM